MALNMASYEAPDFYEFEVSPDLNGPPMAPSNGSPIRSPPLPFPILSLPPIPTGSDPHQVPIEHLKTALVAAAVVSLIFLIAKDAHRAFTRRAHWIPCDFLVLSAFSIQMLNMLNIQNEGMAASPQRNQTMMAKFSETAHWFSIKDGMSIGGATTGGGQSARWKDFLMIHNSRTILSLFTAYVMPAMADPGLEYAWVRWVALVITVFHHVTSQFYSVKGKFASTEFKYGVSNDTSEIPIILRIWPDPNSRRNAPYYVYATIISLCFILLILLLASATIVSRSIERIVAHQIPLVLRGEGELSDTAEKTEDVHAHHYPFCRNVKFDVDRADQHYHLYHLHDDSCPQTTEDAGLRAGRGDEISHRQSSGQISEEGGARGLGEEERYRRHCHYCWGRVEDAVLKAWIIVRAYSVQPVLARSALSASAAVIVTIQIVITIVGGLSNVLKKENGGKINKFQFIALFMQSLFILMAWALINLRWGIAVAYHQSHESDSWRGDFKIEDFWTRHLKELRQGEESKLEEAIALDNEIDQLVSTKKTSIPNLPLYFAIGLQLLLVSFSKACWLVSMRIFHNNLMVKLFKIFFGTYILCVFEDYPKYKKMLEEVQMLGESPESLWVSNRKSIQEAKLLTIQGNQDAECNCEDLVEFLITKRTPQGLADLIFTRKKKPIQRTPQPEEKSGAGERQSQGRGNDQLPVDQESFSEDTTNSWKMKAVSLLGILVHLCPFHGIVNKEQCQISGAFPPEDVKKCLKVYSQAWEIIDLVDEAEAETEADRISSEAADKYFQALQEWVPEEDVPKQDWKPETNMGWVGDALNKLKEETLELKHLNTPKGSVSKALEKFKQATCKLEQTKRPIIRCKGNDSIDWKATASGGAVYNLCDSIQDNYRGEVTDLQNELEISLACIIRECLEKTQNLLLLKSRKWALHRDEKRIGKALYAAGKAKVIMEKLASNKLAIVFNH